MRINSEGLMRKRFEMGNKKEGRGMEMSKQRKEKDGKREGGKKGTDTQRKPYQVV